MDQNTKNARENLSLNLKDLALRLRGISTKIMSKALRYQDKYKLSQKLKEYAEKAERLREDLDLCK